MKRLISSYMNVTRTSQDGEARIWRTDSKGTPLHPNGSMKAKVGGKLSPFLENTLRMNSIASSNVHSSNTLTAKFGGTLISSRISLSMAALSLSRSTKRNHISEVIGVRCSNAALRTIMGEPFSPFEYLPGPANPSMYTICENLPSPRIGIHACMYRFRISCLAFVCGSMSHIVVFGAANVIPPASLGVTFTLRTPNAPAQAPHVAFLRQPRPPRLPKLRLPQHPPRQRHRLLRQHPHERLPHRLDPIGGA